MIGHDSGTEDVTPNPEDFIMSISEQGYRLETAIADLIDNSISAGADRIEVLLDTSSRPFRLFVADNGRGMDEETLKSAMRFPSSSMKAARGRGDLGRFGLGLKTASFSQSRCFTVLSRQSPLDEYCGRTWNVELLKEKGWVLRVEPDNEVADLVSEYRSTSDSLLAAFDETFTAQTIVAWRGLYKFEDYIEEHDCADILNSELAEKTRGHLSLVFHRFMERTKNPLCIRLNNVLVTPFNPFPVKGGGVRRLGLKNRRLGSDAIKVEGFVLPTRSIDDVRQGANQWVPQGKSLMDLEGIYIYRVDRIILYGGWLGLTPRSPRLRLARMRVEIGNSADHLLHLNIAKSQVEMPHDIRSGFRDYVSELRAEAEREFFNRSVRPLASGAKVRAETFISKTATNRGAQLKVNSDFPLVKELSDSLNADQKTVLKTVLRMVNTELNKIRRVHEDKVFTGIESDDDLTAGDLVEIVKKLIDSGFDSGFIKRHCLSELGYRVESMPIEVTELLTSEEA